MKYSEFRFLMNYWHFGAIKGDRAAGKSQLASVLLLHHLVYGLALIWALAIATVLHLVHRLHSNSSAGETSTQ